MHAPGVDPTPATRGGQPVFDRHARRRLAPVSLSARRCAGHRRVRCAGDLGRAEPGGHGRPEPRPPRRPRARRPRTSPPRSTRSPRQSPLQRQGDADRHPDDRRRRRRRDRYVRGRFDDDSSSTTTITAGTFKQITDKISVGDERWSRTSPGPWLEDPRSPADRRRTSRLPRHYATSDQSSTSVSRSHAGRSRSTTCSPGRQLLTAVDVGFDVGTATDATVHARFLRHR